MGQCTSNASNRAAAPSQQQQQAAKPAASVVKHDNPISPLDQHNSQPAGSQIPAASAGAPLAALSARSASLNAARPSFAMTYELKEKLGKGQYAVVHRALHRVTRAEVAVKCIKKATLTAEDLAAIDVEVKAMELLNNHPNFVHMYEMFAEKDYFFIVLELISGGELFDRICEKEKYSEREAREIIRQLTNAIAYMHAHGVVHRDLKPENILLKTRTDDTSIKLADLGFAKLITSKDMLMTTPCGTPGYVAPEILSGRPYTCAADMWSMGVIFYILLCGYPPFVSEKDDQKELFALIREGRYTFDPAEWGIISDGAKDLIRHILVTDPKKRFSADQILAHPWTRADAAAIPDAPLVSSIAQLKRFNARRRLKRTMQAVRTTIRMKLLLAARMQRVIDAVPKPASAAAAAPPPDDPLATANAVLAALKAAESSGMSTKTIKERAAERDEQHLRAATSWNEHTASAGVAAVGWPVSVSPSTSRAATGGGGDAAVTNPAHYGSPGMQTGGGRGGGSGGGGTASVMLSPALGGSPHLGGGSGAAGSPLGKGPRTHTGATVAAVTGVPRAARPVR